MHTRNKKWNRLCQLGQCRRKQFYVLWKARAFNGEMVLHFLKRGFVSKRVIVQNKIQGALWDTVRYCFEVVLEK